MMVGAGQITLRRAVSRADLAAVMAQRRRRLGAGEDAFDAAAVQVMVRVGGDLACSYRAMIHGGKASVLAGYSAQVYGLAALPERLLPAVELGRFCLAEGAGADVLRAAFAGLARLVDDAGAALLFGCSSFIGADWRAHRAALGALGRVIAPYDIARISPQAIEIKDIYALGAAEGMRAMPPLLRSYLSLGGWVSDHAVADPELNTLHVLTGVEIAHIPPARAAALRVLAGQIGAEL